MGKQLLALKTYAEAFDAVTGIIRRRKVDLNIKHIVLVPEKYTLLCERRLFENDGAFDVEVYSLSRWFYKLGGGAFLPREGAIMILKEILAGCELKCFNRSKNFRGFSERLYDTVTEFMLGGVKPDGLCGKGALGLKLDDIRLVYQRFLERTDGMYVDRPGVITLIRQKLAAENILGNAHMYAVNFDCLTAAEEELFGLAAEQALSFTQTVATGTEINFAPRPKSPKGAKEVKASASEPAAPYLNLAELYTNKTYDTAIYGTAIDVPRNIEIFSAPSAAYALKAAARRIRDAALSGVKYSEMCLVTSGGSYHQALRIFNEYAVPLFIARRQKLAAHPLARYLLSLFSLERPDREDYIALSKNPYAMVDPRDSDEFQNYCNRFLIDYAGFSSPFTITGCEKERCAERVRARLYALVSAFWRSLRSCRTADEFCRTVCSVLDDVSEESQAKSKLIQLLGLAENVITLSDTPAGLGVDARNHSNNCTGMDKTEDKEAVKNDGSTLSAKRLSFLAEVFSEGIGAAYLSSLPRTAGCLVAGEPSVFRGGRFKYLFILDFNEGVLPCLYANNGVLTIQEAEALAKILPSTAPDGAAGGTASRKADGRADGGGLNELARKEILQLVCSSEKAFLCYTDSDDTRPSPFLYEIAQASEAFWNSQEREQESLPLMDEDELVRYSCCKSAGLETLLLSVNNPVPLTSALYSILGGEADRFLRDRTLAHPLAPEIFQNLTTVSASRLQTYFDCPYKHFVTYALRAKPADKGKVSALDAGGAIHAAAERFVMAGFDEKALDLIIEETDYGYKYGLPQNRANLQKLKDEIKKLCLVFASHIKSGEFKPMGAEIALRGAALAPLEINGVQLTGSIDYADVFEGFSQDGAAQPEGPKYARIIDYKSGGRVTFETKDLYYGLKLQLPLYMQALIENGYRPAAMFYFPFKSKWEEDDYRFIGVFDSDPTITCALDRNFLGSDGQSRVIPAALKMSKDGSKIGGTGAKTQTRLRELCMYAKQLSSLAITRLKEGYIAPSPNICDNYFSCRYCTFKPACGFSGEVRRLLKAGISSGSDGDAGEGADGEGSDE